MAVNDSDGYRTETLKRIFQDEFKDLTLPDKLLDKFSFHQNNYIFSSDLYIYNGTNEMRLPDLMKLENTFLAFGQPPGYGINNYNFVIYYSDQKRVFMLNIPYGGVYMDNDAGAKIINESFQKLEDFISNSPDPADNAKVGFFYKNRLGFSPYFNIDRETFDFNDIENSSLKKNL